MKVERVLAPNPGPFTGPGTNTYVISDAGAAVVLDPGPVIAAHQAATERTLGSLDLIAVLVTHTHPDHAPAANVLADKLGVEALGFGPGPEFEPSRTLSHGDGVSVGDIVLTAVHTPGHTDDHLCYRVADVVFTGDHIMGGSTVVIQDAAAYMRSLELLAGLRPAHLYPGHGPEMTDASAAITEYINHRLEREREIIEAVRRGASTSAEVTDVVYSSIPGPLRSAAHHQVGVQLRKLIDEGRLIAVSSNGSGLVVEVPPRRGG